MKNLLLFTLLLFCAKHTVAQSISYPQTAQNITRGLDSTTLQVRIDFASACTNVKVRVALGATNNPGAISYIASSITKLSGAISIVEDDISNLSNPIFSIGTVNVGDFIVFSLKRRASCGEDGGTKDNVFVTGTNCNVSETNISANNYQLLAPALTLVAPPFTNNVNLGVPFNRNFTVTNGGNGCLDSLYVWLKYPQGALQFNNLSVAGTTLTPTYVGVDSILFVVTGNQLSVTTKKLCNGEAVVFTENVTALACGGNTIYGDAWSAHSTGYCEYDFAQSNFGVSNNIPNIVSTIINPNYDVCFRNEKVKQILRLSNTGTGAATGVEVVFNTNTTQGSGKVYIDTTEVWDVLNPAGAIIGQVSNFYQTTLDSYTNSACTNISNKLFRTARGRLQNIIIPPGSYVDVEVNMESSNLGCNPNNCNGTESWVVLETRVFYNNQCGTSSYQEARKIQLSRFYNTIEPIFSTPLDVNPGVFTVKGEFSGFRTVNHPNGSGQSYLCFVLPTNVTVASSSVLIDTVNYNTTMVSPFTGNTTDSLWVGNLKQSVNKSGLLFSIDFNIVCGTPGPTTIQYFAYNKYTTCAPALKHYCRTIKVNLKCPAPCPRGGATPTSFSLKRISYGTPDNDNNFLPDATGLINKNLINDHRSVNGDTLLAKWNIVVKANLDPADPEYQNDFRFVNIDFKNTKNGNSVGLPATLTAIGAIKAKIYENKDPLSVPIECTITPSIIGSYYHYELGAACRGGNFKNNDSIVVEALYYVNQYNSYNCFVNGIFTNQVGFDLFETDNKVYSSYTAFSTVPNFPGTSTAYTCELFNDYNEMLRIWYEDLIPTSQNLTGCTSTRVSSQLRQFVRNLENGGNIFPYEYRTFLSFDTMRVLMPPGFTYKPNSAGIYGATIATPSNVTMNSSDVFQSGQYIYFKNLYKYFKQWGGVLVQSDEQMGLRVDFDLIPTCFAVSGSYPSASSTTGYGNGANTPSNVSWSLYYANGEYGQNQAGGWLAREPNLTLGGTNTVQSSDGLASWTVNVQNLSNDAAAPFTYLYINPKNNISNIVVKEGSVTINPNANGFYQLGTLALSGTRQFTITAKTTICNDDSMRINLGWNCAGYPTSTAAAECGKTFWQKVTNYPSQIQLTTERQPKFPNLSLCVQDTVEFRMNSAQGSFADNAVFRLLPPVGLVVVKGQIEFPLGSGNWQDITPTNNGGVSEYAVESHSQVQALYGTKGLPGTIDFAGVSNRAAVLRIIYNTVCGFSNGSRIAVQQRGYRPCGSPIPTSLGFNTIVRTNAIFVSSNVLAGTARLTSTSPQPSTNCTTPATVNNSFIPVGLPSQVGDSILVTLPYGLLYVANSFTSIAGLTLSAASPSAGPNGTQLLRVFVPLGSAVGTSADFSYQVFPANGPSTCGSFTIIAEYARTEPPLTCLGQLCSNPSREILDQTETVIINTKPNVTITNMEIISGQYKLGETHANRITLANFSSQHATAPIYVELFCGFNTTPFTTLTFTSDIAVNNSVSQTFNINVPAAPTCASGSFIKAVVRPNSAIMQCFCDSSGLVLTARALPIKLLTLDAELKQGKVQVYWTAANDTKGITFYVEYSANGNNFVSLAKFEANGLGRYDFGDALKQGDFHFYRIKVVDVDGKIFFSKIARINSGEGKDMYVYPNPASHSITVALPKVYANKEKRISILSLEGKELYVSSTNNFNSNITVNIEELPSGTYFVQLTTAENKMIKKFSVVK